jgi:acetoin:2,6-dichlorophenolindophenol oxidoreductase subunit beta
MSTREITIREAIREALREEMRRDKNVFVLGENVAGAGGIFKVTDSLLDEFGPQRMIDTPIAEEGFVGMAVGAALTGMRPVVEVMFCDFITLAMDPIINQAAHVRYMTGGQATVPLVIRTTLGAGRSAAAQHSQSTHAWFCHIPGMKVIVPSTPYDAKGLLKSAIRDDNTVIFFEDKMNYDFKGSVPDEEYMLPIGKADIKREGTDVTVIATARLVHEALKAADQLSQAGISLEVVDPRTLVPLDKVTLINSAMKTGRVVVADSGYTSFGVTAEIASVIVEGAFYYLHGPVMRVGALDVPVPFSKPLELASMPNAERIADAARRLMES